MLSSAAMESVKERAQIIENLSEQPLVGAPACASEQNKHISDSLSAMTVNSTQYLAFEFRMPSGVRSGLAIWLPLEVVGRCSTTVQLVHQTFAVHGGRMCSWQPHDACSTHADSMTVPAPNKVFDMCPGTRKSIAEFDR